MANSKTLIICNPLANQGKSRPIAEALVTETVKDDPLEWRFTEYHGHAVELARQAAAEGYERIIGMGGDGTVHELVNGLMAVPASQRPALGIIPVGSGNDFSRSLGIPAEPKEALRAAAGLPARPVDVGLIRDDSGHSEYWTNTLGIGFDAVVNIRSRRIHFVHGFGIYFVAALQTILLNHSPMQISAQRDGGAWEDKLLMLVLCNGRREGGVFWVAPEASQNDGRLDFLAIRNIPRLLMLYTIPFLMKGTQDRLKYVAQGKFTRLDLHSDRPLHIHTDGEIYAGLDSQLHSLTIESVPAAVRMAAP
jgi:diacylglycerol kinase (ATP)